MNKRTILLEKKNSQDLFHISWLEYPVTHRTGWGGRNKPQPILEYVITPSFFKKGKSFYFNDKRKLKCNILNLKNNELVYQSYNFEYIFVGDLITHINY